MKLAELSCLQNRIVTSREKADILGVVKHWFIDAKPPYIAFV